MLTLIAIELITLSSKLLYYSFQTLNLAGVSRQITLHFVNKYLDSRAFFWEWNVSGTNLGKSRWIGIPLGVRERMVAFWAD
jgi:hypothetical protein